MNLPWHAPQRSSIIHGIAVAGVVLRGGAYFPADSFDWREQIQGIRIGDREDKVREKFGVPSPSVPSDDGLRRIYHYRNYNLIFELAQNAVTSLGIYSPQVAPKGVTFRADEP